MNKAIVVAGATGEVGKRLVEKLIAHNQNTLIHVLVRAKSDLFHENVKQHVVDFTQLDSLDITTLNIHASIDMAYCCLGTTIKKAGSQQAFKYVDYDLAIAFAKWAHDNGCSRFACISAVGANAKSRSFYLSVKGQTEQALIQLGFERLWLIRPSLLLGARDEFRLGEYVGALLSLLVSPLLHGPLIKYKPIQMISVAETMAALADEHNEAGKAHKILEGKTLFTF